MRQSGKAGDPWKMRSERRRERRDRAAMKVSEEEGEGEIIGAEGKRSNEREEGEG